jgi:hypothetical protein
MENFGEKARSQTVLFQKSDCKVENVSHNSIMRKKFFLRGLLFLFIVLILGASGFAFCVKAYPGAIKTEVGTKNLNELAMTEAVSFDFSVPVFPAKYNSEIRIFPEESFELRWENSNGTLTILPTNFWKPNSRYEILLPQGRNIMFFPVTSRKIAFTTEGYPEVLDIVPQKNASNVMVDIEDPITVRFKKPTVNYYLKFVLNGNEDLSVQNNVGKTEFKLLPKSNLQYGTSYRFEIFAKYVKDDKDNYEKIFESSFTTIPPPQVSWDQNYTARLEQAKAYTQAKITEGRYVDVNLNAQVLSLFENGQVVDSYMISSGKRGMDTPKGETKIFNKARRPILAPMDSICPIGWR